MKSIIIIIAAALLGTTATASELIVRSNNCIACHAVDRRQVGPSFKEIAQRYGQQDIPMLVANTRNGVRGKWGAIPMPPQSRISEADATAAITWILNTHK